MKLTIGYFLAFCLLFATVLPFSNAQSQVARANLRTLAFDPTKAGKPTKPKSATPKSQEQGDINSLAGFGQANAGVATVDVKTTVNKAAVSAFPTLTAEQMEAREEMEPEAVPIRKGAPAKSGPVSPPTEFAPNSMMSQPAGATDMTLFSMHSFTSSEVSTTQRSSIQETSLVSVDNTVFFTGNWYAAKSTNGGSSFTYISPYTFFPSVNGGFCCDQVTAYAPNQDMALWGLQYIKDSTSGTFRLARTIGSSGIGSDNWAYYDFTPQMVGFASGNWFDYPSMTVGSSYLYVASNVFRTSDNGFTGSVVMRLPLSNLAAATGFNFNYFSSTTQGTFRCTEGAGPTMYFASFNTTTQMRIHRWDESSTTVFWDDVNLNAFTSLSRDGVATSPDGTNWAARADGRPLAAYLAAGVIGVMFMAKQGGTFPYPYTIHARFNQATRALITQGQIWNSNYAWLYPSAYPNAAGYLAGTLQIGGGTVANGFPYPGTQLWVADDIQPLNAGTVGGVYGVISGNAGPTSNAWGDFFTVRPNKNFPNSWVGASFYQLNGGTGSNAVPVYFWFGRGRDGTNCTYSINPTSNSVSSLGGTGSVAVTAPTGCAWSASPNDSWISITSGNSGSGNGNVSYSATSNSTSNSRTGTVTIAGQTFTLTQSGNSTGSSLRLVLLPSPVRLLDTRPGQPACDNPGSPVSPSAPRTEQARLACAGVPASAQAIVGNLAIVNSTGTSGGYATLYPGNVGQPNAANVNFAPGWVINNFYMVGLAPDGTFKIFTSTTVHVVIDVTGYYAP